MKKQMVGLLCAIATGAVNVSVAETINYKVSDTITATLVPGRACFPPVTEMILGETKEEAQAEAYQTLAKNRYKDKVTIDLSTKLGSTLKDLDFTYYGVLKGYNPADASSEKTLPVSAISEDSKGKKTIQFGRLADYWFMD